MPTDRYYKTLLTLAIIGLVVGFWGVFQAMWFGKGATDLGSYVPWGLWVAVYLFFLGLTAGAFLITILTYVFRVKIFAPIGPLSAFTVLVAITCEVIIISFDLGHFFRAYRFLLSPGWYSMIFWMVVFTNAMILIYLLECYFLLREDLVRWSQEEERPARWLYGFLSFGKTEFTEADRQADHKRVRFLSILSLPVGLIFYGINGAIFAVFCSTAPCGTAPSHPCYSLSPPSSRAGPS
jgi:Ni/Fe-hydrogenase subunit HybB-like protein